MKGVAWRTALVILCLVSLVWNVYTELVGWTIIMAICLVVNSFLLGEKVSENRRTERVRAVVHTAERQAGLR